MNATTMTGNSSSVQMFPVSTKSTTVPIKDKY